MKRCRNCKAKNIDIANFCAECGARFVDEFQQPPRAPRGPREVLRQVGKDWARDKIW